MQKRVTKRIKAVKKVSKYYNLQPSGQAVLLFGLAYLKDANRDKKVARGLVAKLKSDLKVAKEQEDSQGKVGKGKARKSNVVTALEARLTVAEGNVIKGFLKPENIAKLQVCIQKHMTYILLLIIVFSVIIAALPWQCHPCPPRSPGGNDYCLLGSFFYHSLSTDQNPRRVGASSNAHWHSIRTLHHISQQFHLAMQTM